MNNNDYIIVNGELYHYGVPGMKWGRRKSYSGNENRDTRRLARQLKKLNEEHILYEQSKHDVKTSDGEVIGQTVSSSKARSLAKRDKRISEMYAKIAKKYGSAELRADASLELGQSIVNVILTDKKGKVYDSGYIGSFKPNDKNKKK